MNRDLDFSEFEGCTKAEWLQLLQKELGERTFDSLVWRDENGLIADPYPESTAVTELSSASDNNTWLIAHKLDCSHANLNKSILHALMCGAEMLELDCSGDLNFDPKTILNDVFLDAIELHIKNHPNPEHLQSQIIAYAAERGYTWEGLRIRLVSQLTMHSTSLAGSHMAEINAAESHTKGATAIQELAFALAMGHEQLVYFMDKGHSAESAAKSIQFRFAVGSSFFVEMAKLRAFRVLWQKIRSAYGCPANTSLQNLITTETSVRSYTVQDIHNNLLRATTEAMSAILGGAHSVVIWPYNLQDSATDTQGVRLALNIQHLLREEAYMDQAIHAADGSKYILQLESQIAKHGWQLFQSIEKAGGFMKYRDLYIQDVERERVRRDAAIADGTKVLVGVNKYQMKK